MCRSRLALSALALCVALALPAADKPKPAGAEKKPEEKGPYAAATYSGLALRSIGPAVKSGRIGDLAVDPTNPARYFVAVASGGVWKTENAGTTFEPVFDAEGSFSIGCLALDPRNPFVLWVGTGENNSQRSVGYGDGIYRSLDGGKSWENLGLKASEHIGKILVDPRDSKVVYVACQGPLWNPGGDRGLYKTTDGGKTWKAVLTVSENTGVADVVMDPRDPDTLLASSYQRRRHVWGMVHGGPECAIHKSTDGGATWRKVTKGLPEKAELGRIGLAVAPSDPDVMYAILEAQDDAGGLFRSADRGETWEKRGDFVPESAQYYNELFVDPKDADRVYLVDTWLRITEDGGKTVRKVGERTKHVDNHVVWIDPADTRHLRVGCDGGLYESWDRGATWEYKANLPVAQFYRVALDEGLPFYSVYGGTQDNNTLGGPSRTTANHGATNADWFVTVGGDGFQSRVDPTDPDTVYSQSQHGGLVRYDRRTGERVDIQPQPGPGAPPLRFNWDSPLILSPHSHTRLYFAAQKVFRSDDRGNTWRAVSPDLTRQIDRNRLPMMGRVWSVDAVAKNASTSFYGNIVSLTESPKKEGLLYAGTDDGLVQVTEDAGVTGRRVERFPGIPEGTYVSNLTASRHADGRVYAAFDNHKQGDYRPYLLRSDDEGRTWVSVAGDLPPRGTVYAFAEDPAEPSLLFAGTEFGLYFTRDGGKHWVRLKGGMPTVAVRDLALQARETDLVAATFGRGFYILDDYSPLRAATPELLDREAALFPVKRALAYIPSAPMGLEGKADQGDALYTAENPPFGATFTYYLKEEIRSLKDQRREAEKKLAAAKKEIPYPTWEALRAEDREEPPVVLLTVKDAEGAVVRRLEGPVTEGFHRVAWDLRFPPSEPVSLEKPTDFDPWAAKPQGPLALPGNYTVELAKRVRGEVLSLGEPQRFEVVTLGTEGLPASERAKILAFQQKTARLQRAVLGAQKLADEADSRLKHLKAALDRTPSAPPELAARARALEARLADLRVELEGDATVAKHNEPTLPGIAGRVNNIVYNCWTTTQAPTTTHREQESYSEELFSAFLPRLNALVEGDLKVLEAEAERYGAPWTPGRALRWSKEP